MTRTTTEIKVGIFVILGLIILIYMTANVGKWQMGRDKGYLIYTKLNSAAGLLKDSPVKVLGVTKGKVEKLEIEEDKAKVFMRMPRTVTLPQDSRVYVRSESLLGEKYIEIKPGSLDAAPVKDGGELLQGAPPADVDELFSNLNTVVEGINRLTHTFTQPLETFKIPEAQKTAIQSIILNLNDTSESLKNLATKIERGEGTLGKLLTDEAIYRELQATISEIGDTVRKVSSSEGTLGKLLTDEELYVTIKELMTRINTIVKQLERGEGALGKLFTGKTVYSTPEKPVGETKEMDQDDSNSLPYSALGVMFGEVVQ